MTSTQVAKNLIAQASGDKNAALARLLADVRGGRFAGISARDVRRLDGVVKALWNQGARA